MTKIILTILMVFIAGLITDLLSTRYTQAVANKKVWYATLLSGAITVFNLGLLTYLVSDGL